MGLLVEMPLLKLLNQSTKNYCKILNTVFLTIEIVLRLFFFGQVTVFMVKIPGLERL